MKAVQAHQFGSPEVLVVETVADPVPAPGEVLIKVEYASVNYADIMRRANMPYPFPTSLPYRPGSEVAGVIAAHGDGVTTPPIGTPVFALAGGGANGYAQYVVTPVEQVIPMPPNVDPAHAAALPVAGLAALLTIREVAALQPGETIFIPGAAGGVGSYAIQLAKLLGAGCIIGGTSTPDKFASVRSFGADHVVDYSQPGWTQRVLELTGGRGADVVLEKNGGSMFTESLRVLAPFGRIVVYGTASGDPLRFDDDSIMRVFYNPSPNQSIHVFNLGLWFGMRPQAVGKALGDLISYLASGQLKVSVTHRLPLDQAAAAHRMIEARETTGKIVLQPWA